jgi:4-amino-4-deoxy-L-arabinose transferase-like glycosyltransferase
MRQLWLKLAAAPYRTILALSLALFLSGNWILPLLDRDEPRFAEASREMLQRDDWIIPWFNGQYRFDKPPLIYWCQMGCYRLLGENTFAARLPSVLFATATALLLVAWGRRQGAGSGNSQKKDLLSPALSSIGGEGKPSKLAENGVQDSRPCAGDIGFYAAIILITCLQVLIHARLAVADMPMIFFATAAVWSGWEMVQPERKHGGWWWMFYLSLAMGFLAKGPIAWFPIGGLILLKWRHPADCRFAAKTALLGLMLTLSVVALWAIPALVSTQGQFFKVGIGKHVVSRSFDVMEGHGFGGLLGWVLSTPLYFVTIFFSFFPWIIKLPGAVRSWWPERDRDLFGWYLLVQVALVFGIFSIVRTKLPHYTLPAFPCLSFWLARWLTRREGYETWAARCATSMSAFALVLTLAGFMAARPFFATAGLWRQVQPIARPDMALGVVEFDEPSVVWEFRSVLTNRMEELLPWDAPGFLKRNQPLVLILPTQQITNLPPALLTNAVAIHAVGLNTARFKQVDLTALVKTSPR